MVYLFSFLEYFVYGVILVPPLLYLSWRIIDGVVIQKLGLDESSLPSARPTFMKDTLWCVLSLGVLLAFYYLLSTQMTSEASIEPVSSMMQMEVFLACYYLLTVFVFANVIDSRKKHFEKWKKLPPVFLKYYFLFRPLILVILVGVLSLISSQFAATDTTQYYEYNEDW